MNRNIALAAVLAVAASGAFADDITIDTTPFVSTRTRAEVQAELGQYQKAGVNPWSTSYNPLRTFTGGKTRAEVRAEFLADREQVRALTGEDSGSAYFARGTQLDDRTRLAGEPKKTAQ